MEIIKCKFILITKPTKKYLYFFLFLLGSFLRIFIPDLIIKPQGKKYLESNENTQEILILKSNITQRYFDLIRNIGCDTLFGIFFLIHKIRNKDEPKKNKMQTYNTSNQKAYFIFNDESSRIPTTYKIIFIISIVDIICQLLIPAYYIIEYSFFKGKPVVKIDPSKLYCLLLFDIFARYLFSRWILKTYFYNHHYLSFILSSIGLIGITIADINYSIQFNTNFMVFIIIAAIQLILYSFEDIMNKVAFRTLYILPNTLIFYKGLIQLIYLGIISAFLFGFHFHRLSNNYRDELKYFVSFGAFNILRTYYLVKVIDKFSAQHMTILKVFEYIILFTYQSFRDKDKNIDTSFFLQIIGFSFLTIASLIHNELIIINHPKLKAKTEYYLDKDADKEQYSSFCSDTLFTDSKDSSNSVTNLYSDLTGSDMS